MTHLAVVTAVTPSLMVRGDLSATEDPAVNMSSVALVVDDRVDVDPVGKQLHVLGVDRSGVPAGVIWAFGGATAPAGWLICDGSAISRTTYAALFATLGTAHGAGNGTTTFNIPPPGRILVGKDGTTEFNTLGKTGGAKTHTLTTAEMPSHAHDVTFRGGSGPQTTQTSAADGGVASRYHLAPGTYDFSITNTGGGGAHPILDPYVVVNFIVKT